MGIDPRHRRRRAVGYGAIHSARQSQCRHHLRHQRKSSRTLAQFRGGCIGQYATVKGIVAKMFTSKTGNNVSQYWCHLPEPNVYRLDFRRASPVNKSSMLPASKAAASKSPAGSSFTKESPKFGLMRPNSSAVRDYNPPFYEVTSHVSQRAAAATLPADLTFR